VLCVPLISNADLIGMIYADNRTVIGRFSRADLDLMMIIANQAATAIESARLYGGLLQANTELEAWTHTLEARVSERTAQVEAANAALTHRAIQLETIRQVAQQVTSILDLDVLLDSVVNLIQAQFGYYFVGVWLVDAAQTMLTLHTGTNTRAHRLQDMDAGIPLDTSSVNTFVFKAGHARIVHTVEDTSDFLRMAMLPDVESEIVLPLRVGNSMLGTLNIASNQPAVFSEDDCQVMQGLADQIAVAIRNAQLYKAEQHRRNLTELLEETGRELTSSLEMHEVPGRILALLSTLVPYERGMLMLQEDDVVVPVAHYGFMDDTRVEEMRLPIREGDVYAQLVEKRAPLIVDDVTSEDGWTQLPWLPLNRSWLGVPLIAQDNAIGMISLTRRDADAFSEDDGIWVQAFAAQASIALENAHYYAEIVELSAQLEEKVRLRTEELHHANEILAQLDKTKSDFINVAAHELRTPLTVIKGFAQILRRHVSKQPDSRMESHVDGIVSGANRMHDVIDNMLDVAQIDSQMLQTIRQETLLADVIRRVCVGFSDAFKERNLKLELLGLDDIPAILADAELLQKVFYQLILNAIKYTPDDGNIIIFAETTMLEGNIPGIEVIVEDTGIGIDPKEQELIFEKFYQTGDMDFHSSGHTGFMAGGPGLGLPIARGIVLAHNGKIWVESEGCDDENCPGSRFYVQLPLK
jgi:signal transduction histidine kinase